MKSATLPPDNPQEFSGIALSDLAQTALDFRQANWVQRHYYRWIKRKDMSYWACRLAEIVSATSPTPGSEVRFRWGPNHLLLALKDMAASVSLVLPPDFTAKTLLDQLKAFRMSMPDRSYESWESGYEFTMSYGNFPAGQPWGPELVTIDPDREVKDNIHKAILILETLCAGSSTSIEHSS